jgi:hypothetical protein
LTAAKLVQIAASVFGILAAAFWAAAAVVRIPIDLRAYMAADKSVRVAGLDEMQIGLRGRDRSMHLVPEARRSP